MSNRTASHAISTGPRVIGTSGAAAALLRTVIAHHLDVPLRQFAPPFQHEREGNERPRDDIRADHLGRADANAVNEPQAETKQVQQQHPVREVTRTLPANLHDLRHERERRADGGDDSDGRGDGGVRHDYSLQRHQCGVPARFCPMKNVPQFDNMEEWTFSSRNCARSSRWWSTCTLAAPPTSCTSRSQPSASKSSASNTRLVGRSSSVDTVMS